MTDDMSIQPYANDDEMAIIPSIPMNDLELSHAIRVPFEIFPSLGIALSAFRASSGSTALPDNLFAAFDVNGNLVTPDMLQKFKDGTGYLGSMRTDGSFMQARFQPFDGSNLPVATSEAPCFNPETLFIAAALIQLNMKLDDISAKQDEMFSYIKAKDRSELQADLERLVSIKNDYYLSRDNESWRLSRAESIATAQKDATTAMALQKDQLSRLLSSSKSIVTGVSVSKKANELLDALKNYQLACYVYMYATVMDIVMIGNYGREYLQNRIAENLFSLFHAFPRSIRILFSILCDSF